MKTPRNSHKNRTLRGFTLIELLVVVAVIVILSGLVLGVAGFAQRKAAVQKANAQLKLFEMKLDEYAQDAQGYPDLTDKEGMVLYKALFGDGVGPDLIVGTADDGLPDGEPDENAKVYLADLDPSTNQQKMIKFRPGTQNTLNPIVEEIVDPWGNPWQYRSGSGEMQMNPDFDLWSMGPDGQNETADDIRNW